MTATTSKTVEPHAEANAGLPNVGNVVAFLWVDRSARAWNEVLVTLSSLETIATIYVGIAGHEKKSAIKVANAKIMVMEGLSFSEASARVFSAKGDYFLFVSAPVRIPPDVLDNALAWMNDDPRIGMMSFLSNSGGSLSFPHRNTDTPFGVDGFDEVSLTQCLRARKPANGGAVPLSVAEGALVLVNRSIWEVCGELDDAGTGNAAFALAELSLRGARRGFLSYLDPYTFVSVPWDGVGPYASVLTNPEARHALHMRHPHFPASYDAERTRPRTTLAEALDTARSKAMGLRVLIDGSVLGPKEMGTQLLILKLSTALAQRTEIQWVAVGVPDPANLPHYAQALRTNPKIRLVPSGALDFPGAPDVDIIHRPFQPTGPIPWDRWSMIAKRSLITVQDVIAYRNGAYFKDWEEWDRYRDNFNRQIAHTDGVVSISHDVVTAIREERLPIDDSRVFVVENGADARSKDEPTRIPDAFLKLGWAASPFLFVLGATYAHKNRDLAMRVWAQLRAKGFKHKLVLVGASVPNGSTRVEEALLTTPELRDNLLVLPEVGSEERNWLLRNAGLAVYLTAAEGFGQLPFEAARMDVPTLFVSFGPLRELIEDPTLPMAYDLEGLTARAEALLNDPDLARASIRGVLKNIDKLSWVETARKTVESYFNILRMPARIYRS